MSQKCGLRDDKITTFNGDESRHLGAEKLFELLQQWKKPPCLGEGLVVWCGREKVEKLGAGKEICERGASWALTEGALAGRFQRPELLWDLE